MAILPDIEPRDITWLKANVQKLNIADQFEDTTLSAIGSDIVNLVDIDRSSRSQWLEDCDKGEKIAMQEREEKSFPWPNAANIKDPLMPVAMMQFAARAGAEVIRGRDVVKCHVTGEDPLGLKEERAKRVSMAMSYQCLTEMPEWVPGTDQLLSSMSGYGMYYKKTYRDTLKNRNASPAISPRKIIVHNEVTDLESAERVTHELDGMSRNTIIERIRSKQWLDIEDKLSKDDDVELERFYECYTWYDLDGDGYKEPYIVTVHVESCSVARIFARYDADSIKVIDGKVAQIEPVHCITEFPFLPSPDGKFHKMGFFKLLGAINEQINTVSNQLIDAGTIQNSPPVFVGKGAKLPGGNFRTAPGKFTPVESTGQALKDNIFIPPMAGPSATLFNFLTRLDDKGMKLASVSETMMGDEPQANVPATTILAIIDQGLKVFSSILMRLYHAFEKEYRKLYRLNFLYMDDDEYLKIIDCTAEELIKLGLQEYVDPQTGKINVKKGLRKLVKMDFSLDDCDIQPVMDPSAASEAIRLARAQAIYQADPQNPAVKKYFYGVLGVPDKLINEFVPAQAAPDPKMIMVQAKITEMGAKHEIELQKLKNESVKMAIQELETSYRMMLLEAQAVQSKANAELALANSDAVQVQMHIDAFQTQIDHLNQQYQNQLDAVRLMIEKGEAENGGDGGTEGSGSGGTGGMVPQSDDQEGNGIPGSPESGNGGGPTDGSLPGTGPDATGGGGMAPGGGGEIPATQPHATPQKLAAAEGSNPMM
jgi:chaperonin GroES